MSTPLNPATHCSIGIEVPASTAHAFLSRPQNLPRWAAGLGHGIEEAADGGWVVHTSQGSMKLRFADTNAWGVLDHHVVPPSGAEVYVPMRVLPNGEGCEVVLTLFRLPGMSDGQYADDAQAVTRDLQRLKALLEG